MFNFFKKKQGKEERTSQESIEMPNSPLDRNLKGKELEKAGEIDKAIELYEKNIEEEFEGDFPYNRLAIIYRKRKQYQEEIRVLNQAISVFKKEKITSKRQDIEPKLIKFRERLSKAKSLEEND
ncbi:tetratricopeptide repeat protein [Salinicoccus roseus]|uniref:tetratricopeptide repeat protein n=1 Tax=Salinicoccus roseus TaxID=45670 RepID=UPI00230168A1|nr:tetratricopeptide repeat protein [Salinicoccus roseus]